MASDYWHSTQHAHWERAKNNLHTPLSDVSDDDLALIQRFPLPEPRLVHIYLQQQIGKIGRRLNVRQTVLATAMILVRRIYTKIEIRRTNPYLIIITAFYLACKIEECPQHIKIVVNEARNLWPDFIHADTALLGECEFFMISELSAQLIVHHPYRSLNELQTVLGLSQDELTLAWSVVNDHYVTDLPLTHVPHTIAVMAVIMTIVIRPSQSSTSVGQFGGTAIKVGQPAGQIPGGAAGASVPQTKIQRLMDWLVQSAVDVEAVAECTQEMISLYVVWEQYSDRECREQIARFVHETVTRDMKMRLKG